jgi:hypothetical protein
MNKEIKYWTIEEWKESAVDGCWVPVHASYNEDRTSERHAQCIKEGQKVRLRCKTQKLEQVESEVSGDINEEKEADDRERTIDLKQSVADQTSAVYGVEV